MNSVIWVQCASVRVLSYPSGVALSGAAVGLVDVTGGGFSCEGPDGSSITSCTGGSGLVSPLLLFCEVFFLPLGGMLNVCCTPFLGSTGQL